MADRRIARKAAEPPRRRGPAQLCLLPSQHCFPSLGPLPDVRSGRRRRTGRPTETSGRGNFAPDGARRRADASMDATRPVPDGAPDGRSGPGRGRTQPDGPGRGRTGARRRTGPPTGAGPEARPAGRHSPDGARRGPDRVKTSPGQTARAPDRTSARGASWEARAGLVPARFSQRRHFQADTPIALSNCGYYPSLC